MFGAKTSLGSIEKHPQAACRRGSRRRSAGFREIAFSEVNSRCGYRERAETRRPGGGIRFREHDRPPAASSRPRSAAAARPVRRGARRVHRRARDSSARRADSPYLHLESPPVPGVARRCRPRRGPAPERRRPGLGRARLPHAPPNRPQAQPRDRQQRARRRQRPLHPPRRRTRGRRASRRRRRGAARARQTRSASIPPSSPELPVAARPGARAGPVLTPVRGSARSSPSTTTTSPAPPAKAS